METKDKTTTIAELWDRFEKLGNYIETEKILHSWGTKGSDGLSHDGRNHSKDDREFQSLRQQLLERCKPWFGWLADGSIYNECRTLPRYPTPAQLRDDAAVYLFIAWELYQRQKEASHG